MNSKELYEAVGGIDEKYIEEADMPKASQTMSAISFLFWRKRILPIAACLAIVITGLLLYTREKNPGDKPSLKIEQDIETQACYAPPDSWQGLPAENFVLQEQPESGIAADRIVFQTLKDLADYADAFIVVPTVHKTAADGNNMQTAIAEYAETIGDRIRTRQWDDYTISTGNRILIRQTVIGGCTMDEPCNLIRTQGVYLLPVRFNSSLGAYEVVGDFDVLFELDAEGRIASHSQFPELNQYDGKPFSVLLDAVRAIYPISDAAFSEQPIDSLAQAEKQINTAYLDSGFRKFTAVFEKESILEGADVYLFKVMFGENGSNGFEYGAIAKENGAFIRGALDAYGEMQIFGGLGGFPKNGQ